MRADLLTAVLNNIAKHEGRKAKLYRDTKGIPTCGVGHAVQKFDDSYCLNWHRVDRPASREDIAADYTGVKYAKKPGVLFLPVEEIDRILAFDLGQFEHLLESEFPELYTYPDGAVIGLFDLAFNTGSVTAKNWPRLHASVLNKDWLSASKECYRPAVGETRNNETQDQFLEALNE